MKKKNYKKISGGVLMLIGMLFYSVYWVSPYFLETVPEGFSMVAMCVLCVCGGLGFLMIFTKKDDELDEDMKRTMDERKYYK